MIELGKQMDAIDAHLIKTATHTPTQEADVRNEILEYIVLLVRGHRVSVTCMSDV